MNKQRAKEAIRELEFYRHDFDRINWCGVNVVNVRLTKSEAVADIILFDMNDNTSERKNGVRYSFVELEKNNK